MRMPHTASPVGQHAHDDSDEGPYHCTNLLIPQIRRTFLTFPPQKPPLRARRARSASEAVEGTCDRYEREVNALMFKNTPVPSVASTSNGTRTSHTYNRVSANDSLYRVGGENNRQGSRAPTWSDASDAFMSEGEDTAVTGDEGWESACHGDSGGSDILLSEEDCSSTSSMPRSVSSANSRQRPSRSDEPPEVLLARVPRDELGRPTSIGSERHVFGDCRPCAFLANGGRPCTNGVSCLFCHFPYHPPRRRIRLCKRKRLEMRNAVAAVVAAADTADCAGQADGKFGESRSAARITRPPKYVPLCWPSATAMAAVASAITRRTNVETELASDDFTVTGL